MKIINSWVSSSQPLPMIGNGTVCEFLVVFDARVPDISMLLDGVVKGAKHYILTEDKDAITVITQLLSNTAAKRLALVAHGEPGVLHLGSKPLNGNQLQVQSRLLQEWGVEEISLYGCEVAKGEKGRSFVTQLSDLTGAQIAASEDQIGKGHWVLSAGSSKDMTVNLAFTPRVLSQYTATLSSIQYNLNSATYSSNPSQFTDVNGTLYFTATNSSNGTELWKIDPSTGLPVLLEIESGTGSSNPSNLMNLNGTLYFTATNSISGSELWKIDANTGLPVLLEIEPGSGSPNLNVNGGFTPLFTNVNGTFYFFASTISNGNELWKIDPNTGNPVRVTDIKLGSASSNPSIPIDFNGTLYFTADSDRFPIYQSPRGGAVPGSFYRQLWKIDPNTNSPVLLDLPYTDSRGVTGLINGYNPSQFTNVNGTLYFVASLVMLGPPNGSNSLWKIDPSIGIPKLIEIEPSSVYFPGTGSPFNLTNVNEKLYFTATSSANGSQIWQIDPNTGNPVPVTNFDSSSNFRPDRLLNVDGVLYFTASTTSNGIELWKLDPSTGNPVLLEIEPGSGSSNPSNLGILNGTLYFFATTTSNGKELWKIDPNTGLPVQLEIEPGSGSPYLFFSPDFPTSNSPNGSILNVNGTLYFLASTSSVFDGLWKIDPNNGSPVYLNINQVQSLTSANGTLYFTHFNDSSGTELWKIDPSTGLPVLLEIEPGNGSSYPSNLKSINGTLYFSAYNSSNGTELWKIDPSTGLPMLVADVNTQELGSRPSNLITVNGTVYFLAHINSTDINRDDTELWKIDPSTGNPLPVTNFEPINGSTSPSNLTDVNGTLYFVDFNSTYGIQLWKIDPITGNPIRVTVLGIGSRVSNLTNVNGTLYFIATDIINGTELWRIDPNTGSPVLLEIGSGSGSSDPNTLVNVNGTLYFIATNSASGTELWRIDPNTGSPVLLEIEPDGGSPDLLNLTNVNGTLFFTAANSSNGSELWKIDPSTGLPVLLEIEPGGGISGSSYPSNFTNVNGTLYFTATNSSNGTELWRIEPGTSSPVLLEIELGSNSSYPSDLTNVSRTLYFVATNGANGHQLWKIDSSTGLPLQVTNLDPSINYSISLENVNGTLYFRLNYFDPNNLYITETWKIDPATGSPVRLFDFDPINGNAYAYDLMDVNGTLYFIDFNDSNGNELWKIDPSTGKSVLLEIEPGSGSANPNSLTNINGVLYFIATNSANGTELWKIDPSTGNPVLVQDFYPGAGSSNPIILGYNNGKLYISADNGINGPELWAITTNNAPALTGPQASLRAGTEDTAYILNASDLLLGFTDADGDILSVSGLTTTKGILVNNNNGTYTLTPASNFNGILNLTYNVIDGNGGNVAATQTIFFTPDNGGGSWGDPHIITFDQLHYDFQSTGDFILARALDSDLEVQVRQTPWELNPSTTINTALATVVDGNRVEFYIDQPFPIVNGILLTLQPGDTQFLGQGKITRTTITGYGIQGDLYTLTYPNGDTLTNQVFSGFLMDPSLDLAGTKTVTGLLGNNNGNPEDDLALSNGSVLINPLDPAVLYGDFANSWRVSADQSLFSPAVTLSTLSLGQSDSPNVAPLLERYVFGGNGNDTLIGVQNPSLNPGSGEVDLLMGNKGADTFVLGDKDNLFYVGSGQQDYALITDLWSEDSIQLHGSASDYVLGAAPVQIAKGTGIFLTSDPNELIGVIQGDAIAPLSLSNSNLFHFV